MPQRGYIQHSLPIRFDLEQAARRLAKLDTEELERWADSLKEQIEKWVCHDTF